MFLKTEIKDIIESNLAIIASIEQEVQHNPWSQKQFLNEYKKDGFFGFAAYQKQKVVGFIIAHRIFENIELLKIAVNIDSQKKGIGEALINTLKESCKSKEIERVTLEVYDKNHSAIALYKKSGFTQIAIRKNYYGAKKDAAIFILNIS